MIIKFDEIAPLVRTNFQGGNDDFTAYIFNDGQNRMLIGKLEPGASIGFHVHDCGSEMVYIVSGSGIGLYDDQTEILIPGVCHYCPKGHGHSMENNGSEDLVFFAVVTTE